jgi:hypothetical protein
MTLAVKMVFEILPALALGFGGSCYWQVRRDELDRSGLTSRISALFYLLIFELAREKF